ncbi:Tim44/TimA family putative adaptor protein [Ostreiculturibacter nitratireducens]|uniref:Tim44/TimA family putative adaptor protein n=1 Tax=Ostreiculturibacter nitratireducens TaxID=3075226 RepID=UPI0031B605FD
MSNAVIQLLVLAGIAVFLILKLRSVLGSREGFEKPPAPMPSPSEKAARRGFEVIEGGPDLDITDHAEEGSPQAKALAGMKQVEPQFKVGEFLQGARGAYEMILMAFEKGELETVKPFLANDVYESFAAVVAEREAQGLTVEAQFLGVREVSLADATFNRDTREAEISVRFQGDMTSVVRDSAGQIIEGSAKEVKKMRDVWTFERVMGSNDPNWQLVATGE